MIGWDRLNRKNKRDVAIIAGMVALSALCWEIVYALGLF